MISCSAFFPSKELKKTEDINSIHVFFPSVNFPDKSEKLKNNLLAHRYLL